LSSETYTGIFLSKKICHINNRKYVINILLNFWFTLQHRLYLLLQANMSDFQNYKTNLFSVYIIKRFKNINLKIGYTANNLIDFFLKKKHPPSHKKQSVLTVKYIR